MWTWFTRRQNREDTGSQQKLVVGLGNPGPKYETTRHNAGFLVVDLLAEEAGADWQDSARKFHGHTARGGLFGDDVFFLKPMTFMNLSGRSVANVLRFYRIKAGDMVVIHDDIDVPAGKVKAKIGGGPGGHKGIASIIEATGYRDFHRIKLGVGRPHEEQPRGVKDWVLDRLDNDELLALQKETLDEVKLRLRGIFQQIAADKR